MSFTRKNQAFVVTGECRHAMILVVSWSWCGIYSSLPLVVWPQMSLTMLWCYWFHGAGVEDIVACRLLYGLK